MRDIARRLIAEELKRGEASDTEARAALRVCDKLRGSLSVLAGRAGFQSLLARALTLAAKEVPWLGKLKVELNGVVIFSAEFEAEVGSREAARGGIALVVHLLELLATFIGGALTVRLVQQVWPNAALRDPKSGGKA